jgi:hypothetical protein
MPITVKHSGNAAPSAWGAFGAGQGKRYAEDAKAAMDRIFRREEEQKQRSFQAGENERNRQFQADESGLQFMRTRQLSEDRADIAGRESDVAYQRSISMYERQSGDNRRARNMEWDRRRDDFTFELSERQRQEDNRLADIENEVMISPEYSPDEKKEFQMRIQERRAGVQPTARRRKPDQVWPNGMKTGDTFKRDGYLWSVGKEGEVTKEGEDRSIPSSKDLADIYQQAVIANKDPLKGTVNMEAVKKYMTDFLALQKEMQANMGGQDEEAPGAGGTPQDEDAPKPKSIEEAVASAVKAVTEKKTPTAAKKADVEPAAVAPKPVQKDDPKIKTMTLKSGKVVRVRLLWSGKYEEVE